MVPRWSINKHAKVKVMACSRGEEDEGGADAAAGEGDAELPAWR